MIEEARPGRTVLALWGVGLDDLVKVAGSAGLMLYGIGLVVVQIYLTNIGVSDFSLVRTRFLLTGILALLPILLTALVLALLVAAVALVVSQRLHYRDDDFSIRFGWGEGLLFGMFATVASSTLMTFIFDPNIGDSLLITTVATLIIVVVAMALSYTTEALYRKHSERGRSSMQPSKRFLHYPLAVATIVLVGLNLTIFAASVFPQVPEQLGGGRPRPIEILLTNESAAWAKSNGLVEGGPDATIRARLLWETDTVIVFRETDDLAGPIYQVNRSDVGVLVVNPQDSRADISDAE